jgi:DNA (cytosine-5)-methyltransferase 1
MLKVLDLFSGIGGFSLGLEMAGMETVAFCEISEDSRDVLHKHWPEVVKHADIRELDGAAYAGVDVVCGGFPCQPYSSINIRGKKGEQHDGFLWPEMRRVISEAKPTWVIGENVARFAAVGLERVQDDLERLGYESIPFIIPACAIGSPQIRDRVWIVAHSESQRVARTLAASNGEAGANETGGRQQNRRPIWIDATGADSRWSGQWTPYPGVCRVVAGLPSRMDKTRLKQLGNTILPQIPHVIGRAIMAADARVI